MEHPKDLPSTYATIKVAYGAEFKHLYARSDEGGYKTIDFHATREAAEKAAMSAVHEDANEIVAIVKIEELIGAVVQPKAVVAAKSFSRR